MWCNRAAPTDSRTAGERKGECMKFTKSVVLSLALLMSTSLFAASSGSLHLTQPVQLNGTQIKAGDYKVTWEGTGSDVSVSILKGKDVVAKAPAQLKDLPNKFSDDAAVLQKRDSGASALTGIRFGGKTYAIEFAEEAAAAGMKSGSSTN
jgi:hypothetical protein